MPSRDALRRLFPPSGRQYLTFDLAAAVTLVTFCVYVMQDANSAARWLSIDGQRVAGAGMALAGLLATICSYFARWTHLGLALIAGAGFFWMSVLLIGLAVEFRWASLGFAILYAFFAQCARRIADEV